MNQMTVCFQEQAKSFQALLLPSRDGYGVRFLFSGKEGGTKDEKDDSFVGVGFNLLACRLCNHTATAKKTFW